MNVVLLSGRLTSDPEIRYTADKKPVASFQLAVGRDFKKDNGSSSDFIYCVAFGHNAIFCEKYLYKGLKMIIRGRWQTGSYTKQDGSKVYTNDCVIDHFEFAESKNGSKRGAEPELPADLPKSDDTFVEPVFDDDLPFE